MLSNDELKRLEGFDFQDLLEFNKNNRPNMDAFCHFDNKASEWVNKTNEEFFDDVAKVSAYIQSRYGEGKHLAICSPNCYAHTLLFFGIINSNNVAVLLDATMKGEQLLDSLRMTDSVAIFAHEGLYEGYKNIEGYSFESLENTAKLALNCEISHYKHTKDPERLAILFATSGVTSNPKFVMISQKNMIYAALNGVYRLPLDSGFKALSILPPHHVFEVCCGMLYPMMVGGTIIRNDSPAKLKENLHRHSPDFIVAVPSVIAALNMLYHGEMKILGRSGVSSLKYIIGGGASVQKEIIEDFKKNGIYVIQGYGLTETGASVAMNGVDDHTSNTVGRPMEFAKVKLSEEGEILVSCPDVMLGYYKNPTATSQALVDGYLRTGDIGEFDEEGHLIIRGRIKNIIVFPNGEKVYPEELEERLSVNPGLDYIKCYGEGGKIAVDIFSQSLSKEVIEGIVAKFNESVMNHQRITIVNILTEKPATTALGKPLRR